jgi:hypothetical protein
VLPPRVVVGGALAIAAAATGIGCGGDEGLSKEEYVSRLSSSCKAFSEREDQIGEPRTLADLVQKGPRVLDAFEETILAEVRSMTAPAEIASAAERLRELAQQQRNLLQQLIDAATDGDVATVLELASANAEVNSEASSIALELGAGACAEE